MEKNKKYIWTEEQRKKQSDRLKQRYLNGAGPSGKGKLSPSFGIKRSDEYKKNMSELKKGMYDGENNPFFGKKHTPESLEKIKQSGIGREPWNKGKTNVYDEETRKKMGNHKLKGRTFEEIYGPEEAARQKEMRKQKLKGHEVNQRTREAVKENRSKQIFPMKDTSIEVKMQELLKLLGIDFYSHHYISDIQHKYRCDIFVPSLKLVIECDGDYYHGHPTKYPNLNEYQKKQKERDEIRTKELQEQGYRVIRLWESDIKRLSLNELNALLSQQ